MRTMSYYYDLEDEEETDDGRQTSLRRYIRIPRLRKLSEDESFLEEWIEPNRYASA